MSNERDQKLKYIFGANPGVDEFHVTSDDHAFRHLNDAQGHASTLPDAKIILAKRSEYVSLPAVAVVEGAKEAAKSDDDIVTRHVELFGKKPHHNASEETILKKIQEEEARLEKEGSADPGEDTPDPSDGTEGDPGSDESVDPAGEE